MNNVIIMDVETKSGVLEDLKERLLKLIGDKGQKVKVAQLNRRNAAPCTGCLRCITQYSGECVTKDLVNEVRKESKTDHLTIYLTPVIFGHFSSIINNAMCRGTGSNNWQVIIGYAADITEEERNTFIDLVAKHRGQADVVHPGMDRLVEVFLTTSITENMNICRTLRERDWL